MRAGEKSWMAHAWYLERVLPNLYALKNVNRSEGATDQPIGDPVDEDQLRRYAALMDDFRKENEAKVAAQTPTLPSPGIAFALTDPHSILLECTWRRSTPSGQ
jgi:hypothetical protein